MFDVVFIIRLLVLGVDLFGFSYFGRGVVRFLFCGGRGFGEDVSGGFGF